MTAVLKALALTAGAATAVAAFTAASAATVPATTPWAAPVTVAAHPSKRPITVVLVHGAWADASSWAGETARLLDAGYSIRAADTGDKSLSADIASLDALLTTIPGPVLLVGHSYGGAVITNAAAHAKNVVGLVYIDAFEPAAGESVAQLGGARSVTKTLPESQLFDEVPAQHPARRTFSCRRAPTCAISPTTFPAYRRRGCGQRRPSRTPRPSSHRR